MRTSTKSAIVAAFVLLAFVAGWTLRDANAPATPAATTSSLDDASTRSAASAVPKAPRRPGADESPSRETVTVAAGGAGRASDSATKPATPSRVDFPEGPAVAGEVVGKALLLPGRAPVEGAVVKLMGGGQSRDVAPFPDPSSAVTGKNGVFRIKGFAPGFYVFEAKSEGHTPRTFNVTMAAGVGVDDVEVVFGGGGSVEGVVMSASGPAAGVTVRINRSGTGGGKGLVSCKTGADGRYRFDDLPAGSYSVEVGEGGMTGRTASVEVATDATARLDFLAGAWLVGRLTDGGAPVAGAVVRVTRLVAGYRGAQTKTDKDGGFRIDGLEPGEARIGVQTFGDGSFAVDVKTATLVPGENRVDVQLGQGDLAGEIAGRVFAKATGEAISSPQVQISLYSLVEKTEGVWSLGGHAGMGFANARGEFRIRAVRPGRYRIQVYPNGRGDVAGAELDFDVAYGERKTGIELALPPRPPKDETPSASILSGTVKDGEGRPMARTIVRAQSLGDADRTRQSSTDETGRYRIERLEPGRWRITVQVVATGTNAFATEVAEVAIAAGANALDVRLDQGDLAGEIRGRVFVRSSGRPLSSKEGTLALQALELDGKTRGVAVAWPDDEGRFRFRSIRGGSYRVLAWPTAGGFRQQATDVTVAPGQKLADVEIALDALATGKVVFVVRDEQGKAVESVSVESLRDGKREQGSTDATSADGVYETHFEVGTHAVTIRSASGTLVGAASVEVREGETTKVEVVLRPKQ